MPMPTVRLVAWSQDMPPVPPVVIFVGGGLVAAGAAYLLYKAYKSTQQAQEAAKEGIDAGAPQVLSE
jgi:hypothetical protein